MEKVGGWKEKPHRGMTGLDWGLEGGRGSFALRLPILSFDFFVLLEQKVQPEKKEAMGMKFGYCQPCFFFAFVPGDVSSASFESKMEQRPV